MDDLRNEMPLGFAFSMAMNEKAMVNFGRMSEAQRQQVITESKKITSKHEMNQLVDRIAENHRKL